MKVVSNTSPLIFLSKVDSLDLLSSCFSQVYIPEEVKAELGYQLLPKIVETHPISSEGRNLVDLQYGILHRGELEAIQLAYEVRSELVLLDDLLARKKAKAMNMNVMGTLGLFLTASYDEYISPRLASEKIDILINEFDMFVAPSLLKNVKKELESLF
ncbi:MAG: DUF3368 domain-containing protein [Endozoicomonadaceae bacterium]|nr:DUF3368 domain-containing protein [Endozoicomonadaceae bacterium]